MILSKVLRGYKPLAVIEDRVVLGRGRRLYLADLDLTSVRFIAALPSRTFSQRMSGLRMADRILRLSISALIAVSPDVAFAAIGSEIWKINLGTGEVSLDFTIPDNRKVLALSILQHEAVGGKSIAFGEYFMNRAGPTLRRDGEGPATSPIKIWFRPVDGAADWRVFAQFPAHDIDHVHHVVASQDGSDIFVLMGDTGPGVGFWKWDADSAQLVPFQTGSQANRSTWALVGKDRLFYATDTQLEQNYLIESDRESGTSPRNIRLLRDHPFIRAKRWALPCFLPALNPVCRPVTGCKIYSSVAPVRGSTARMSLFTGLI